MTQPDASTHHSRNQSKEKNTSPRNTRDPARSLNRPHSTSLPNQDRNSQSASEALLVPPSLSLTSPTPETTPVPSFLPIQPLGQINFVTPPALRPSITRTSGKRKAEEVEVEAGTQPKDSRKEHRATFAPEQRRTLIVPQGGLTIDVIYLCQPTECQKIPVHLTRHHLIVVNALACLLHPTLATCHDHQVLCPH